MAGICSDHREAEPGCQLCKMTMRDLLPDWDRKVAEAEAAGAVVCRCGFRYYRTTTVCPLCGEEERESAMNAASRFSLTCDELVQSIKLNNRRRAYELVDRLRETFTVAMHGRPKEEPRPHGAEEQGR